MKYKVGDRVQIKSLDWYNENKDEDGDIEFEEFRFVSQMSKFCGKILTIDVDFEDGTYLMKEDNDGFVFTIEMFEGLVEEMSLDKAGQITDFEYEGLAYTLPDGYQFKDENGNVINATKIVLEKKKKEYPKTYAECCGIVGDTLKWDNPFHINRDTHPYIKHLDKLIESFCKLLICRDAYWKIAGEEMGLGKPWEPGDNKVFGIIRQLGKIQKYNDFAGSSTILEFPTEEMRDVFYENFKELIEICKELL